MNISKRRQQGHELITLPVYYQVRDPLRNLRNRYTINGGKFTCQPPTALALALSSEVIVIYGSHAKRVLGAFHLHLSHYWEEAGGWEGTLEVLYSTVPSMQGLSERVAFDHTYVVPIDIIFSRVATGMIAGSSPKYPRNRFALLGSPTKSQRPTDASHHGDRGLGEREKRVKAALSLQQQQPGQASAPSPTPCRTFPAELANY
ncbi:hypothetical protein B0T17DRAFT_504609 [Bombardia bombarda]|uniref:Uncharacterized protein n=1 Tax=Bombardia bombarda TaxID=252184 RepID=A0AA39XNF4_9PEZI|nr:hypothetical protein B0T17DRAFT_504609 [Bombardia bombarda]